MSKAALLVDAEEDVLAFFRSAPDHWRKIRSTNPLERLDRKIGRLTDVRRKSQPPVSRE